VARVFEAKNLMKAESIKKTILASVPKGTEELNEKAFDEGYKLMKEKM
jgi:2-oxoglutarate ferredoxin oxidoreductase subunit gamma